MQNVSNDFKTSAKNEEFPTHKEYLLLQNYASNKQFGTEIEASSEIAGYEDDYANDGIRNHKNYWKGNFTQINKEQTNKEDWDAGTYSDTEGIIVDTDTKLLLHCNGADASTTFTDSSKYSRTITAVGNAQIDTAQYKFGGASGLFDGNGDYLTAPDSDDWYFGTGDFTIDFWVRFNSVGDAGLIAQEQDSNNLWLLWFGNTNKRLDFYVKSGGSAVMDIYGASNSFQPSTGTCYHIALVRSGNNFYCFVDGVLNFSGTSSSAIPNFNASLEIGATTKFGTYYLDGWLDEVRIVKGVALWTSDFTPPDAEYHLDGDVKLVNSNPDGILPTYWSKLESDSDITSPQIGPGGTKVGNPTYENCKFNKGIYNAGNNTDGYYFSRGTCYTRYKGTIELWYKPNYNSSDGQRHLLFGNDLEGQGYDLIALEKDTDGKIYFKMYRSGWQEVLYSFSFSSGDLIHLACVWDSTGFTIGGTKYYQALFINGEFKAGNTNSTFNNWLETYLMIGRMNDTNFTGAKGVIDNLKIYDYAKVNFSDRDIEGVYPTSGFHTSQILDLGTTPLVSGTFSLSKTEPDANHTITFQERHGNQSDLSDASEYATIIQGGNLSANYRYWQVKSTFSGNGTNTPLLHDYKLFFKQATLQLTFTLPKKLGFVKIYSHPIDGAIKRFNLLYYDGTNFNPIIPTKVWGMNRNNNPAPVISISGAEITTNASLNYIMFDEIEAEKLLLVIGDTIIPDDFARVCEIEAYRCIDISLYLYQTLQVSRQMDATWNRFQGGTFQLQLFNESRRFSTEYTPTPTEIASGYFNSEFLPNCQLLAFAGFNNENVQMIEGYIDTIANDSDSRIATISGRDKFKLLNLMSGIIINQNDVSTKTIENCIEYVCNKCNISSSELNLAPSNITLDYFISRDKSASDLIYELVQAMGNATMVINENGQIQTRFLTNERSWIQTSQSDFNAGTKNQTDITSILGSIILDIDGANVENNDFENITNFSVNNCTYEGGAYIHKQGSPDNWFGYSSSTGNIRGLTTIYKYGGSYSFFCESDCKYVDYFDEAKLNQTRVDFRIIITEVNEQGSDIGTLRISDWAGINGWTSWSDIYRIYDNTGYHGLAPGEYQVKRNNSDGTWTCTVNTSDFRNKRIRIRIDARAEHPTDPNYSISLGYVSTTPWYYCSGKQISVKASGVKYQLWNISGEWVGWGARIYIDTLMGGKRTYFTSGDFTSQSFDTHIANPIWGKLEYISNKPDDTNLVIKTQTSSDGTTWDAEQDLDENGNIQSASKQHIKWKVYFTTTNTEITPRIDEVVIRYLVGEQSGGLPVEECIEFLCENCEGYPENEQGSLKSFSLQKSDQQGGENAIYNRVLVKANPFFQSASATENQWQCNSYQYQQGTYTIWADLENTISLDGNAKFYITDSASQKTITYPDTSIAINNGTASIEWSNTKCKITLDMTASEVISEMKIQAYYYTSFGAIEREAKAIEYNKSVDQYSERTLSIDNNFIQSQTTAQDIANSLIQRFQYLTATINSAGVYFAPHIQLYDRVKIIDYHTGINANDFYIVGISHSLQTGKSGTSLALTKL